MNFAKDRLRILGFTTYMLVFGNGALLASPGISFGTRFPIETAPTKGDWQRFHILTEAELKDLWDFHSTHHATLGSWSWQWRLGWLQVCGQKLKSDWCAPIMEAGLQDDAMAVRAEAASQFSSFKTGSKIESKDVDLLVHAYRRKDNYRRGKPLFVCQRIISALHELRTPEATKAAENLVRKNKKMTGYWNSLKRDKKAI